MENNLQEQKNKATEEDYYADKSNKSSDIAKGVFGGIVYIILSATVVVYIGKWELIWLLVVLYLAGIVSFFAMKRHYIAISLLLLLAVPAVVFGGCILIFAY